MKQYFTWNFITKKHGINYLINKDSIDQQQLVIEN